MVDRNLAPIDEFAAADVRKAVRRLSMAFRRSQDTLEAGRETVEAEALRRAEAVLFAAGEPLSAEQVTACLPPGTEASAVLMELQRAYAHRGVNLVEVGGRWRFQTAGDLAFLFVEERQEQKKLTQAALETLAIIAYAQPVTRAEIEAVRGVAVSKDMVEKLMETGWVRVRGRRRTPGRPVTYGTTPAFLEHFGLESLDMLPGRAEFEAQGLLSSVVPDGFGLPGGEEEDEAGEGMADARAGEGGEGGGFQIDFLGEAEASETV